MRNLIFSLFLLGTLNATPLSVTVSAESAVLMNADTGCILYEKKPHAKLFPASVTKIATAAYALKVKGHELDEMIAAEQDCIGSVTEEAKQRSNYTLPSHWLVTDAGHMGIKRGEILSFRDLLYGVLVASADDAANVIAYTIGNGSIPAFMEKLNEYIKELGCKDTYFNNPHGLHHPQHMTTAYDMALIAKEALKNPVFCEMVSTSRFTRPKTNKQESTILVQTNRLLRAGEFYYPRAIGVKTGRTSKAGNTFVAAAIEGERTLIAVLLNVKERKDIFRDAIKLFDAAFEQPKTEKTLIQAGSQKYTLEIGDAEKAIKTYTDEDFTLSYFAAEKPKIKAYLQWDNLKLPIQKGQKVGSLQLKTEDHKMLKSIPLFAQEEVKGKWKFQFKNWVNNKGSKVLLLVGFIAALLIVGYLFLFKR